MEIIYQCKDWQLVKNPETLNNIASGVRCVILDNGDLYIENIALKNHNDILKILFDKNILKGELKKGCIGNTTSIFLNMQRINASNIIAIGESNSNIYRLDDWRNKIWLYKEMIRNSRLKHQNINFSTKLIGANQQT